MKKCFGVTVSYPLRSRGAFRDDEVAAVAHRAVPRLPPIAVYDTGAGPFCRVDAPSCPHKPMRDVEIDFWRYKRPKFYEGLTAGEVQRLRRAFRGKGFKLHVKTMDRCAF